MGEFSAKTGVARITIIITIASCFIFVLPHENTRSHHKY